MSRPAQLDRLPPQAFFLVSALFHYLGPALAVLLFARVDVLGVAWLRIASAALVFAAWRRPWKLLTEPRRRSHRRHLRLLLALGVVLAAMNTCFYLAVDRLPLATVGSIEFLGTVILAAAGARTRRNVAALGLTTAGVAAITAIRLAGHPLGFVLAFANCALFMAYVILGHRIAGVRPGDVRAHARAASRIRGDHRRDRAPPVPHSPRYRRHRPRDGRRRDPPGKKVRQPWTMYG